MCSIDITTENMIPFPDAPKHIPGRPHIATVNRFRLRGSHGVKLETVKVGGRRFTSLEAIQRFVDAVTAAADGRPATITAPPSTRRQRELDRVDAELARAGI